MKHKTFLIGFLLPIIFVINSIAKPDDFPFLKGPYLGQKPPGMKPEIFAPNLVSKSESRDLMHGFFDKGKLFILYRYPMILKGNWTKQPLILMKEVKGRWTAPYKSKQAGKPWFYNLESVPAGERIIFAWTKNFDGTGPSRELYLWSCTRTKNGWGKPIRLEAPVNQGFDTWPSLSLDKTLYFISRRAGGEGGMDIYMSRPENGKYKKVINLGKEINTNYTDEDPYIAPDGSYLLFDSNRPGGYGSHDLYITFCKADRTWAKPINLGEKINSEYSENRPYVSPDAKYLFFTSTRRGSPDAYWVDADIISSLKDISLK